MKNKLCIIGVYFGKLPNYFSLWLKSAEKNPTIDFFVFTDQTLDNLPTNVQFIKMNLASMRSRATKLLGFEANLYKPYKCCDFKPIYGLIFADYIIDYDYWGHCDFDMIFGDLQYYFDLYNLYNYDRFLALGHLSMYKNTTEVNYRFKCNGNKQNYKTVFQSNVSYAFDEMNGMTALYLENNFDFFYKNIFADIACTYDRYRIIENYSIDEKPINYKHQVFCWENGKIYRYYYFNDNIQKEEKLYIHFKKRPNFVVDFNPEHISAFYITKFGFIQKNEKTKLSDIKQLNPYKNKLYEKLERGKFLYDKYKSKIMRKIKRRFN